MKPILNSLALLLITVAVSVASDKTVIRVGHFPNITTCKGSSRTISRDLLTDP
jgi:hypothetical protein